MAKTMFEKIWDAHVVRDVPGEATILYIDRHLVHEATSPQAFAGLRDMQRTVRRPAATIAVIDHMIPTVRGRKMINVVDKDSEICYERAVAEARAQPGNETFARAWAEGRTMTLEQAVVASNAQ